MDCWPTKLLSVESFGLFQLRALAHRTSASECTHFLTAFTCGTFARCVIEDISATMAYPVPIIIPPGFWPAEGEYGFEPTVIK